tara:strand:+ start:983 stop:1390 length:408 start_codon:yes stop_codon:yes gene_type:complete
MTQSPLKEVKTDSAPSPVGPYSQAVIAGEWLYCSGQIPINPLDGSMIGGGDIQEETKQVMKNLLAVLNSAGVSPSQVVKTNIYLLDLNDFEAVNIIYAETFGKGISPARACVQVSALPKGSKIEIDCVAWIKSSY